ncbi:DUF7659 family protein [Vibrio sp. PNB22_3_1]
MKTINCYTQEKLNIIMREHGAFFAFSPEQVHKGVTQASCHGFSSDKRDYSCDETGMFAPITEMVECERKITELYEWAAKQRLQDYGKQAIIKYELANHECGYTGDPSAAVDAVAIYGITEAEVHKVFWG